MLMNCEVFSFVFPELAPQTIVKIAHQNAGRRLARHAFRASDDVHPLSEEIGIAAKLAGDES